jgi:DNA-directed RNA polymerase subunit RPC12/RpoP
MLRGFAAVGKVDVAFRNHLKHSLIGSQQTEGCRDLAWSLTAVMPKKAKEHDTRTRLVECPKCKAKFLFRRKAAARFDDHGFESYSLRCEYCQTFLVGIIDPFDGTLLVSTK